MKTLYVLVHAGVIWRTHPPYEEIQRIKREEEFFVVDGNPSQISEHLPKSRKILVCGAHAGCCPDIQCKALIQAGYDAQLYHKGILNLKDIVDFDSQDRG